MPLEKIAGEKRLSVSAVIESILYERMKELKALQGLARDQRKFARKPVSLPAFIMNTKSNAQHFQREKSGHFAGAECVYRSRKD